VMIDRLVEIAHPLDSRELATVLAALRFLQATIVNGDTDRLGDIDEIRTEAGTPLDADEIDALCERLNQ